MFNETGFNNISNFSGDGSCETSPELRGLISDPMLGPLTDNGGLTPTHLPLPGSPVIDNGFDDTCADFDQPGLARPIDGDGEQGARCDIGAVEAINDLIFKNGFDEFSCNLSLAANEGAFRGCRQYKKQLNNKKPKVGY